MAARRVADAMARRRRAPAAVILAACAALSSVRPAMADDPATRARDEAREAARALATQGYERLEAGDYEGASALLRRAEATYHAPTHLLYLARALRGLGRLAEAKRIYQQIVREELASYAPDAFLKAQSDARRDLAELAPSVPSVTIRVTGGGALASVTVDRAPVVLASPPGPIDVDPGRHEITATGEGGARASWTVDITRGQRLDLPFQITAGPLPVAIGDSWALPPAIVSFGVGAAGLVGGVVIGSVSAAQVSDIRSRCAGDVCPSGERAGAENAATLGEISTAAFVVGFVGIGAGATFLILAATDDAPPAARPAPAVTAEIGPASLKIRGHF